MEKKRPVIKFVKRTAEIFFETFALTIFSRPFHGLASSAAPLTQH
jgi:hypothetical protein